MRTEFASQSCGNGFFKKNPNMAAIARSGAFQRGGHIKPPARFEEGCRIPLPVFIVEIHRHKETSFVLQHGIDTHDKIEATVITPRKMPADHVVSDRKKAPIGTVRAFDSRLLTDTTNPFIRAGGRITGFPGLSALEAAGINILSPAKERSKQLYFGGGRRIVCDGGVRCIRRIRFRHQTKHLVACFLVNRFHMATIISLRSSWRICFCGDRAQKKLKLTMREKRYQMKYHIGSFLPAFAI